MVEETKKVLITGASGLLGSQLYKDLSKYYKVYGTYMSNKKEGLYFFDLCKDDISIFNELKPDIVIHNASMARLDECEENKEKTYDVNVEGTKRVIKGCKLNNSKIIYISTDFVFDGNKGNYKEDDKREPLSVYARTKADAEDLVVNSGLDYIIARVVVLYGTTKNGGYVYRTMERLANNEKITGIVDHIRTPALVNDIPEALYVLIEKNSTGIYHVCGPEVSSSYDMALAIADVFGFAKENISSIKAVELKEKAVRPLNTSLDTSKIRNLGIKMHGFKGGLQKLKDEGFDIRG